MNACASRDRRVGGQRLRHGMIFARTSGWSKILAGLQERRLGRAVELVDHQHRIARLREPVGHLAERGAQPHDVGPDQHGGCLPLAGATK